jgi:hypothetical protein
MVSSIQVTRWLAHCVLVGSLAELIFSFRIVEYAGIFADG